MTQYSLVETVCFFGTLVATYQGTLRHSPLDNDTNSYSCKEPKLCITDQQLNSILTNSCKQPHQSYTTTSSPPQLLAHRQTQPQPLTPYRQQPQWLHHCFIHMIQ